ncbi:hypothetical protein LC653_03930 [Nostoc sp. CHAB 5784]|uniref:hypothetical protein n=1 Tax=Nostoc mirabile TaxID=2907820 RepID=UPI001E2DA67E|nr:hypothetical protein [Nostoc mirabile]MCC5663106.1 hypothetical protein [Nostoc mirabile CHAB5784]
MTVTNDHNKQEQIRRLVELGSIARQRHLDTGGNPHLSVGSLNNNDTLNEEEKQEFLKLANQIFDDKSIANYLKKNGNLRERFMAMKESMRISE